jgi:hypothetical protein
MKNSKCSEPNGRTGFVNCAKRDSQNTSCVNRQNGPKTIIFFPTAPMFEQKGKRAPRCIFSLLLFFKKYKPTKGRKMRKFGCRSQRQRMKNLGSPELPGCLNWYIVNHSGPCPCDLRTARAFLCVFGPADKRRMLLASML